MGLFKSSKRGEDPKPPQKVLCDIVKFLEKNETDKINYLIFENSLEDRNQRIS